MTWLRHTGLACRRLVLPAFVALGAVLATAPAQAAFIAADSGNTQPYHTVPGPGVGGTVNFAVFDNTGGTSGDTFGTGISNFNSLFTAASGSAAFDTTAKFLYLYQTVNNGPSAGSFPISTNTVFVTPSLLSSYGTFTGTKFSTTVLGTPAGFGDPSTGSVPTSPVVLVSGQAGLSAPSLTLGSSSLRALYSPELVSGAMSILWGYTSNSAPVFAATGLIDGGTTADGRAPAAAVTVPEPSAVVLSLIGVPFALLLRRRVSRA